MKTSLHNGFLLLSSKQINRFYFIRFLHKPVLIFICICMALVSVKAHNKTINPTKSKEVRCKVDRDPVQYHNSNIILGRKKSADLNLPVTLTTAASTWLGVDNNWNNPLNWSPNGVPDATTDVTIPAGLSFYPIISTVSGTGIANDITMATGATLTVTGATLQIAGAINNSGTFDVLNGTLNFIGAAAQNIDGNIFINNTIKNLIISNIAGVTVLNNPGNLLNITGDLSFGIVNGATLNTGNNIVLLSNATTTARVADITNNSINSGNTINGTVTVERYFAAHRAWRLLTSPVSNNTGNIFNAWQAGGGAYTPGKGMFVSGPGATTANGLDFSSLGNYSMYTFDPITSNYVGVADTKTQLLSPNIVGPANIGYFTFVRGDRNRSPDNTVFPNTNSTTLSSTGFLQTGIQTFTINSGNNTFQLIGNPYASPIDFTKISKTMVNPFKFYVHDPNLSTVGGFVVMDDIGNTGTFTATPPSSQDNNIQSGQAFFVEVTGNNAAVSFNESNKSTNNNPSLFRPAKTLGQRQSFLISLLQVNANDSTLLVDGSLVEFDESFNAAVDIQDALKFTNINENLGIQRDNKTLTLERRPVIKNKDTVFLQLTRTTQRSYRLEFAPTSLDPLLTAFLEDSFTGSSTALSVFGKFKYDFTITPDPKSSVPNRFRIVFKQSAANGPLPVTYKRIVAYEVAGNISVEWTVENELNIKNYEVEKSTDGINFVKVNTTTATGAILTSITYKWIDANASGGNNFYRIRNIGIDGKSEYSIVVVVKMGTVFSKIRVYPNPVANGVVIAEFKNMALGIYQVRLLNNLGQTMLAKKILLATGTSIQKIEPTQTLTQGIYQLEITAPSKEITNLTVVVK